MPLFSFLGKLRQTTTELRHRRPEHRECEPNCRMSGLRAQIMAKKAAAEAAKAPQPAPALSARPAAPAPAPSAVPAVPTPAPKAAPAAPAPTAEREATPAVGKVSGPSEAPAGPQKGIKKGFLTQNSGALYPEGSNECAPELWRAKAEKPVLEIQTSATQYEIVGNFNAAGSYIGKEDFDISRSGYTLRVKGRPPEEPGAPQSLIAGVDESIQLPLDADWDAINAEFRGCTLRVTVPRISPDQVPARVLPPQMLRKLEALSVEEAKALIPEGIGAEELFKRLEALPEPAGAPSSGPPPDEEIEEISTPGAAAD